MLANQNGMPIALQNSGTLYCMTRRMKIRRNEYLGFIPELNGLRAIAIGAVFLNHTFNKYFPGGFIGVDIFFVLSGWLITTILCREFEKERRIHLGNFYARRALRLMPALLALLLAYTSLLTALSIIKPRNDSFIHEHLLAVLSSGFYFMNWTRAFDLGPVGYLLHTWSLGIEEQFYILWPLLLIAILRYFSRDSAWKIILIVIVMTMGWRAVLVFKGASAEQIYHAFDTRIDSLLIGCLLALVPITRFHALASRFSLLPILILTIALLLLEAKSCLYFLFGITTVGLCGAWLVAAALFGKPHNSLRKCLRLSPLNYCGQISYGFYLWHFPIYNVVAGHSNTQHFGELKTFLITAVSTLLIASASYYVFELPFLKLRHKFKTHTDTHICSFEGQASPNLTGATQQRSGAIGLPPQS
jgi:peptidoglycan/LPS O-acetylase OafA/YrhL